MTKWKEEFPTTKADRLAELENARVRLLEALGENSSPSQATQANKWSKEEIAYHLHLAEKRITKGLKNALSDKRHERVPDDKLRTEWEQITLIAANRETRFNAPEALTPSSPPSLKESIEFLKESRSELLDFVNAITLDDLASFSMPHPLGVSLTGLGWLTMIAHHELRHTEQIKELV